MTEESFFSLTGNKQSTKSFEAYLREWKQMDNWIHVLFDRVNKIENRLLELEAPNRRKALLKLLASETKPRRTEYIRNRLENFNYSDIDFLVVAGMVKAEKIGNDHQLRYSITEIGKREAGVEK